MTNQELYMLRCIELASYGAGNVAPNPMVGAVIVHNDIIIGEGWHKKFGEDHAEVNAIKAIGDKRLLHDSTLYVNLEPCSHYGKTPPCAEMIINKHIPRVVIACTDPFPEVAGKGIKMLREAGIDVVTGVLEKEAMWLNRYFITTQIKKRPYIILKWAQSMDRFIDRKRNYTEQKTDSSSTSRNDNSSIGKPYKFSTTLTRMMVHKLRSEVQAIMVGTNTAILDNPSLTVHHWTGKTPLRVVIDNHNRIPKGNKLFTDGEGCILFSSELVSNINENSSVERVKAESLEEILDELYKRQIQSLLVEGGAILHKTFFKKGLWDEIVVETAPVMLNNGVKALRIPPEIENYPSDIQYIPAFVHQNLNQIVIKTFYNPNKFKIIV